jgi:23S rRNA (guanosine2251-2'-O)-methyltransferase
MAHRDSYLNKQRITRDDAPFMTMVVGVGFEPTYATRADLQSAAFNHSATPPARHLYRQQTACKNAAVLRDKKAQLICQQRSHFMPPKSGKKHTSAKNRPQNRPMNPKMARPDGAHRAPPPVAPKPPQNGFFIWGRHAVFAALANTERRIAQIYVTADTESALADQMKSLSVTRNSELPAPQIIDRNRLDGIGGPHDKAVHQGIAAAVWPLEPPHLDDFLAINHDTPLRLLLLDQLSDPRNVGAILRSARAFNVAGVITTFRNAAEESGALARAASGAMDHVPYLRVVNLARAIEQLQDAGIVVAGLAGDGRMPVADLAKFDRLAIVLGAEGTGLRRLSRDHCNHLVRIDIDDRADSLNVSNAAAIALYAASTARR